jgi:uncharacterized protein (TIGR03435 family)
MTLDRDGLDKTLRRHLGLFGSPSIEQIEISRARVREQLLSGQEAAMTGVDSQVSASPGLLRWWRTGLALAAATGVIVLVITAPWHQSDWLAVVEAADGSHYQLAPQTPLRSTGAGGTMLTLKDGSRVEMRSQSELSLERAPDGIGIRLQTGGLVVDAAQQHDGHLYVHTRDMTVAVVGTMFVVNAEERGSRVTVIEGEVRVREGTVDTKLRPGQQVATSAALAARPVKEEVGWSRHADAILAAFAKGMAETSGRSALAEKIVAAPAAVPRQAAGAVQASRPEFEEASIRQCDPDHLPETPDGARGGGANSFQLTPGRLRALCMTTATLIRTAYGYGPVDLDFIAAERGPGRAMNFGNVYGLGVEDGRRVRGGPDWVRSETYTVNAIAGAGVEADAESLRRPMLQRLLERRFQLKAHIEAEDVPAFALAIAKGGLKIAPVTPGACEPLPARSGSPLLNGQPVNVLEPPRNFADVRRGEKPSCGLWMQRNGPNMVLVGGEVPLSALTQALAPRLGGVRVIDKTSLTDRFNFILEFAVDENAPGLRLDLPGVNAPTEPSDVPRAATIFTAVDEQLGLRLETTKAAREFIVIDHVERPSPN